MSQADARRKILFGAIVLAKVEQGEFPQERLQSWLNAALTRALAAAFAPGQVQVVVVPAVGHNTLDLSPQYLESVRAFIAGQ